VVTVALLVLFAFISGVVTIISPCLLPVLPVVLAGGLGGGFRRPLGIVTGFMAGFIMVTLVLSALVHVLGFSQGVLRWVAIVILAGFGVVLAVPRLREALEAISGRALGRGPKVAIFGRKAADGYWAGIPVGLSLGLVWAPCVGPIMASVMTLALGNSVDFLSVLITLSYALGTGLSMLVLMFGGRALLTRFPRLGANSARLQQVFGVVMLAVALMLAFGLERKFQTAALELFPGYGAGINAVEDNDTVRKALEQRGNAEAGFAPALPGAAGSGR